MTITLLIALNCCAGPIPNPPSPADSPSERLHQTPIEQGTQERLRALLAKHDYEAAETLLAAEAAHYKQSQPLLLVLADVLFLDGKQLNTVVVLKKAELLGPLDERSRFLLALSYVSLGKTGLATHEFETLEQANPNIAAYPYWLSRLAHRRLSYARALTYAQRAVQLDPTFARAQDQLGLCYAAMDQKEEAIRAYQEALRLSRAQSLRWPWPALNLGTVYLRMERFTEAQQALAQALAIEPHFPPAHYRLGQVLEKQGDVEGAIRECKAAAEFDPTYPDPHYVLARIYRYRGDASAVAQELRLFKSLRESDLQKGTIRPN